ncbi:MAG: patatin family protein [Clostridia bacterium]|nr:patatin family protein [Clostridia bacterium]
MLGLIDVGGGMRDIYGAGAIDCFIDNGIKFDICIGVSAGSANLATFLANQRDRTYRFYSDYAQRKEYMSFGNYRRIGEFFDLDYIYSVLSNDDGEDPLDCDAIFRNDAELVVVATDAKTGKPAYFTKKEIVKNDLWLLKASSSLPIANRAHTHGDCEYFDGGLSDPIPVEKAFELGCDRVVVIVPRPLAEKKHEFSSVMKPFLKDYPEIVNLMANRPRTYNSQIRLLREYEKQGKVILICPDSDKGMSLITKDKQRLDDYYKKGYNDAEKIMVKI